MRRRRAKRRLDDGGPCPPAGDHPRRAPFTVFAVGASSLPVKADASAAAVGFNRHFNTLAQAAIMGLFERCGEEVAGAGAWNSGGFGGLSLWRSTPSDGHFRLCLA